jgi:hypothetical protein
MSEKTIRELINEELDLINKSKDHLDAFWLSERLVNLSVLYGNLTSHIAEMESGYFKLLQLTLDTHPDIKFNRAESMCKASDEYLKYRQALALEKATVEVIRSCKKFIKLREQDEQVSHNF